MCFKVLIKFINLLIKSVIISSALLIAACGGGGGGGESDGGSGEITYESIGVSFSYSGPMERVYKIQSSGNVELTLNLDLGSNTRTVYYIFTNTNFSAETDSPKCLTNLIDPNNEQSNAESSIIKPLFSESAFLKNYSKSPARGKPEISEFNSNPWKHIGKEKIAGKKLNYPIENGAKGPLKSTVGETNDFMNESTTDTIAATCRKVVTDGTKTLNIWVANNCWSVGGSGKSYYVTQAMVDAMADKFLKSGTANDIYDWVTNIYGSEWGTHSYSDLITADNNIHILLYDIDNDNSTTGGTLGFFWAKDNFQTTYIDYSNQKIMFYIDAVMYATPAGTWEISDPMPAEIISTLAHEFQHMIHFYQKNVVKALAESDTWINEMCSLVTEDLLADKILVDGPRGVTYDVYDAGSANNIYGRLPLFNYWNDAPLTTWLSGSDAIISYSVSYAFGAFLARNYEGAELFKDIVQGVTGKSLYGDYRDVVEAVKAHGGASDLTMADLMRDWGAAVVLSNKLYMPSGNKYNNDGYYSSTINSIYYQLGSINMFNYKYEYSSGNYLYEPWYYSTNGLNNYNDGAMYRGSNIYVKEASVTGMQSKTFRMRDGVKLTVVVKE